MSEKTSTSGGGIGFFGLLTIVFITLKLTDHIDWSWWWVWSPMLISVAFWCAVILIVSFVVAIKNWGQ